MVEPVRPCSARRIFVRVVGDERDALGAFRGDLPRDLVDGQVAFDRLSAGHRDGVVVEDLVGDVDAGRRRGADGERAGMAVGAVADILEDVVAGGERRLTDPVGALAAHLGEALGVAVHPQRHVVAADARIGAAPLRHVGRGVVRAAGAEMRDPHADVLGRREDRLRVLELLQPRRDLRILRVGEECAAR